MHAQLSGLRLSESHARHPDLCSSDRAETLSFHLSTAAVDATMQRIHEGLDTLWTAGVGVGEGGGSLLVRNDLYLWVFYFAFFFFLEGGRVGLTSFGVRA